MSYLLPRRAHSSYASSTPSELAERVDRAWEMLAKSHLENAEQALVDPRDAYRGADGETWLPLGLGSNGQTVCPYQNEQGLAAIRNECRSLSIHNEFAINGHENRISYIVGVGHVYQVVAKVGEDISPDLIGKVQGVIDDFVKSNRWHARQQEIVHRKDRDGECFLRMFVGGDSSAQVRFVEPWQVTAPTNGGGSHAFGVEVSDGDAENPIAYWVKDGDDKQPERVEASEIQHRKAGVDCNWPRGLSLYHPVRKNLARAARILRNASTVMEIQTAIAMIRKHGAATASRVTAFAAAAATSRTTDPTTGRESTYKKYAPGTILDVPANTEYDFPTQGIDPARYVAALQAELRAIASRLVMPEFMLSSDASNANYASTMVAEGPSVKMFERLQADMTWHDLEIIWGVLRVAEGAGKIPKGLLDVIDVEVSPPVIQTRDSYKETQRDEILNRMGVLSRQSASRRAGLDYDQEQSNNEADLEQFGGGAIDAAPDSDLPPAEDEMPADAETPVDAAAQAQSKVLAAVGGIKGMLELLAAREAGTLTDDALAALLVRFYQFEPQAAGDFVATLPEVDDEPEPEPVVMPPGLGGNQPPMPPEVDAAADDEGEGEE